MSSATSIKPHLSFDAVFYYVTDMREAVSFYRDTLGLPLVSEDFVARFDLDGVLIELVPVPPGSVVPGNGNARLCFAVRDLAETLDQLHARGVKTTAIRIKRGGKLAFFRDPDGNELSLWEYTRPEDAREIVRSAVLHR
ncbi:MAG TPA: VOC family protein [Terriglobales bacterium]|nr:VOC family protein [Terriglobales bacterium]